MWAAAYFKPIPSTLTTVFCSQINRRGKDKRYMSDMTLIGGLNHFWYWLSLISKILHLPFMHVLITHFSSPVCSHNPLKEGSDERKTWSKDGSSPGCNMNWYWIRIGYRLTLKKETGLCKTGAPIRIVE